MKLTETHKKRIKEALQAKHFIKEGIIDYIFGKRLVKKLSADKEFIRLAKKVDSNMDNLRKKVKDMEAKGERIPASYKNILNLK
jgi:hypothetical protein